MMTRIAAIGLAVFVVLSGSAAAQQKLYRWSDSSGRVFYTDRPPPKEARNIEQKALGDRPGTGPLPYDLQQATKLFPVTVYASNCGAPCDNGRRLLNARGVPFAEKDATDPIVQAEIRKVTGADSVEVPILMVGKSITRGWEESQWNAALDAANYPKSSKLPPTRPARRAVGPQQASGEGSAPQGGDAAKRVGAESPAPQQE